MKANELASIIEIDALVVLQIVKHCKEQLPTLVSGQILGLDYDSRLEDAAGDEYQLEMMRCLREVNVDNNTVGWYQSTYLGAYLTESLVASQYSFQSEIPNCVVIVCDPLRANQGHLSLKAFRLKPKFMNQFKETAFSQEQLQKAHMTFQDVVEELPVRVRVNSHSKSLLQSLSAEYNLTSESDFPRLDLSAQPFLERNLESLVDCIDSLSQDHNRQHNYDRALARQKQLQSAFMSRRRQENAERKARGEPPLPDDTSSNPIFRVQPPPSRLESLLTTKQVSVYCSQINNFASDSLSRLYLSEAVQN